MMTQQEELGDLKLYRIPEPVTVAAKSQKQIALLDRSGIKVDTIYRQRLYARIMDPRPVMRVITTRNRPADGLGLPLPGGRVVVFAKGRERPVLIGQGPMRDYSVGEDVEIEIGTASAVTAQLINLTPGSRGSSEWELTVNNPHAQPIRYEAEFETGGAEFNPAATVGRRDGRPLWSVAVPANGRTTLRYTINSSP